MPPARLGRLLGLLIAVVALPLARVPAQGKGPPPDGSAIHFPNGPDRIKLPLARHFGIPAVQVAIAGKDAGWFLIDTASPQTVIDAKLAARLKLTTTSNASVTSIANAPDLTIAEAAQFSLGGVSLGSRMVVVRDLDSLAPHVCRVVGINLLREAPFTLDFREPSLSLYRPGKAPDDVTAGASSIPLSLHGGSAVVRASLDGRQGRFALDTATASLFLSLVDAFALRDQDVRPARQFRPDAASDPIVDAATARTRVERFEVAGRTFERAWASVVPRDTRGAARVPASCVGVIGPRALGASRWTFDFPNGLAWVEWLADEETDAYVRRATSEEQGTARYPALLRAIEDGRPDAVKSILARGADVNVPPPWGAGALAAAADSPDLLRRLLARHAEVDATGPDGRPALVAAAEAGNLDSVRLLLSSGARTDAATPAGFTALHRAAEANDAPIVQALLAANANPGAPARDGTTPVIVAAHAGARQALDALVKSGADVRAASQLGYAALHAAAIARRPELARTLIDAGADVNARAADGATPLAVAALEDDPQFIRTLLAAAADPEARLASGMTPLTVAIAHGHVAAVEALRAMPPPDVVVPFGMPGVRVPLAWCEGWPCARLTIDGKDAGWFLVSLRSPGIVLDAKAARHLGLARLGTARPGAEWFGDDESTLYAARDVSLDGLSLGARVVMTADLDALPFLGGKIAGLIGWSALAHQPVTLDFREPSLTFHRRGEVPPAAVAAAMPLRVRYAAEGPAVWARVEDEPGWFFLESRVAPGELIEVTQTFATARPDLFRGKHALGGFSLRGGRATEQTTARLDGVSLAGRRWSPAPVAVAPARAAPWRGTLDGTLALPTRDTRLTLDPATGKAWLEWLAPEPQAAYVRRVLKDAAGGPLAEPPLLRAVADRRDDAAGALLDRGAAIEGNGPGGFTPLMLAVDRPQLVRLLLAKGADPNATASFMGVTPLLCAAGAGNAESVKLLLAAGARPDQPNTLGQTPVFRAAQADYAPVVDALAIAGADLDATTRDGWTPLATAATKDSRKAIAVLLRRGAQVNLQPAGQASPLGIAAYNGHVEVARALIAAGADLNMPNRAGVTPLMAAAGNDQPDTLRLLLAAGADPSVRFAGRTALDIATERRNLDAMQTLKFETAAPPR